MLLPQRAQRLSRIHTDLIAAAMGAELVVIEGPAISRNSGHVWDRAGLWWLTVSWLIDSVPVAVITPSALKKYATGKGNSGKEAMLSAAIRRLPSFEAEDNNSADAAWLYAMAADHYHGVTHVPQSQRAALGGVPWPEV